MVGKGECLNMKLNFIFSLKHEIERVQNTLKKIDFFKKHEYRILLPKGIQENSTSEEIKYSVTQEWNEKLYEKVEQEIRPEWVKIIGQYQNSLKETKFVLSPQYNIYLTRYGVGGSYGLPNNIVLNVFKSDGTKKGAVYLAGTIAHEITHLLVEEYILEYKVSHWNKEYIVSKFLCVLLPHFSMPLNPREDEDLIDDLFNAHYPDVESIIKLVGEKSGLNTDS